VSGGRSLVVAPGERWILLPSHASASARNCKLRNGVAMDVIRVRAPSRAHAERLVASLDGGFSVSLDGGDPSTEVGLRLDGETSTKLAELFDLLGRWLTDGGREACQIGLGERTYTLLAAKAGEPNDPTSFLLERTIQLQNALDSRVVIEQAKGVVAARESISPDEAFKKIRRQARGERRKLHDLAAEIVATTSHAEHVEKDQS
jgi:ANTAR domain-containing protein